MLRAATCLCVFQVLFALRDSEVAHLIPDQDQPSFIDTPTVPASSAIVTASEEVPQVQDLEVDLSKIDLAELEELPNCTGGKLPLLAKFYKVTRHVEIQQPCNVTADGTTLLVNTTLKFVETARLDGKLSVKAMNALQGPCFAFKSDAFVAASAELHFANCHNIRKVDGGEIPDEVHGGAMNVRGSLTVMGSLIIRDCGTKNGNGGAIAVKQVFFHNGSISIINSSAWNGGAIYVEQNFIHRGGSISVQGSSSAYNGGAIYVEQNFIHTGGNISVEGSSVVMDGGAIYVGNFNHSGGSISIAGSSAKVMDGGAIYVDENFAQSGGSLAVMNSSANESGGAIHVRDNFHHSGGNLSVEGTSAKTNGGAVLESSSGVAGDGSRCLW